MKNSIKREQSQAGLSFAEREKFRPQVKNKLLLLLALLLTAATGAWATTPNSIVINGTPQVGDKSISLTYHFDPNNVPGLDAYAPTLKVKCAADNKWDETLLSLHEVSSGTTSISLSNLGEFEAGKTYEVCFAYNNGNWVDEVFQSFVPAADAPAGYTVSLKDGVKDADKWTVKVGEGQAQALPIGGLKGDGSETVTLQYNGRLKVKGVKATSDAAPAAPALSITSPSVGQVIGSDGKNYAAASVPSGVTKVAMIAYVSGSNGLAIALADEGSLNWETAKSTCEAKTPAFTGGTWKLPSQDDWKQMFSANGGSDESYTGLNTAITTAGGTALPEFGVYWSSTPNGGDRAWLVNLYPGAAEWDYVNVSNASRVRACLAFTVEQAAKEPATVTTAPTGAAIVGRLNTNSTKLVSGGVADGGTLMYAVTTTNTKPASTDGFSDAVPTAQSITASGKVYVWYYVKGDDTHTDSEIAATAIEVPVADIVWDATNASDIAVSGESYMKEGVTLSCNADMIDAWWNNGIEFSMNASGGYTFTAPTGKAFTKIEMKPQGPEGWDIAYEDGKLGNGWTFVGDFINEIYTVTWKGSAAASTVELLTGTDMFGGGRNISYIAFYLSE